VAPWAGAATLITTRSTEYGWLGRHVDLDVLDEEDAYGLLTSRRAPEGSAQEQAAREIVRELGRHPAGHRDRRGISGQGHYEFRRVS